MFQVDGYKVEFVHDELLDIEIDGKHPKATACWISLVSKNHKSDVAYGHAYCSVEDQYNKNRGRKLSLSRALKMLTADRNLRKRFWDEYFRVRHGKY